LAKEKRYYVYIMASRSRILYVGMTGFLMARILHHKSGETDGFFPFWEVPPKTKQPRFSAGLL
jgi:predicted GIY-YIG superfamily endonuclease